MRLQGLGCFALILISTLFTGCATQPNSTDYYRSSADSNLVASPTAVVYSHPNIQIFDENNPPPQNSQLVKMIEIDAYNEYGIMRQQAQIDEILKEQACSLGGNAVIIIDNPNDKKHCYAEVVQIDVIPANNMAGSSATSVANTNSAATVKNLK